MNTLYTTITGLFYGTIGTFIGGLIGISLKKISNKFLSFLLALASGLMLSVISFELLPEAMQMSSNFHIILGIFLGILLMIICNIIVEHKITDKKMSTNSILKTGIVVSIGLAIHNIPEGLAIGTGLENSIKLGVSLALAIAMHDIPEGISMAAPLKKAGMSSSKILFYVLMSGLSTGIGAMFGSMLGSISTKITSFSLSFASGAMLYVVSGELTPEYSKLHNGRISPLGNIIGFILGYFVTQI